VWLGRTACVRIDGEERGAGLVGQDLFNDVVAAAAAAAGNDWLVTGSFTRQFSNLQQISCY